MGEGTRKISLTPLHPLWEKGLGDEGYFLNRTHVTLEMTDPIPQNIKNLPPKEERDPNL